MSKELYFYFDFISPYAYFAWHKIVPLCERRGLTLRAHPVVFGKLLDHWGQLGPAEIVPKRAWLFKSCARYASRHGLAFEPPQYHPFKPLAALRLALPEVCGDQQQALIGALLDAGWGRGIDLANPDQLSAAIDAALGTGRGAEFIARTSEPVVKTALIDSTAAAIEHGVFGVPTMIINDELFWGCDQFDDIEIYLDGRDPLNAEQVSAMLARPAGIQRSAQKTGPS